MNGTVAITDHGWYEFLLAQNGLDEVNFWTPSAHWAFRGEVGSPFFFKLKARYGHAVCGFAHCARYRRLPDWLAWETFEAKNGCPTLQSMRERIVCLIHAAKQAPHDPVDRIGHDAALADFGRWALVTVPTQGVLAPDDPHAFTAIQEIAKRHLQLDVVRAEVKEALSAIESFETRDPIESAYNHLQSVYDDAYYYAGLACGITLMNLDSSRR